ncbi:hypothetical protein [Streptomyces sp. KL118A]|uniref:hypothetical protein n=1 Tax=Streptomyces sp. KL118A TaxID=3045153 RepID=UPI00278C3A0F|nr:hypothetical protein [Streptomyces sp. KL118A]
MPHFPGRFRFERTRRRTGPDHNSAPGTPYMTGNTEHPAGNKPGNPLVTALQAPPLIVFHGEPSLSETTASLVIAAVWMGGVYLLGRTGQN